MKTCRYYYIFTLGIFNLIINNRIEYRIITVENYISKSVLNDNKELHTSKQDKKSHGLGTQIIKKLVKKNNGTCDYHEEGNMFCCEIRW